MREGGDNKWGVRNRKLGCGLMSDADRTAEERRLLHAAARGDPRAWECLYESAFDSLFSYVQWRCGGRRDWAEDIVQETWMIAVRKLDDFRTEQTTFLNWLRGIACQLSRNHFRKVRKLPRSLNEGIQELPTCVEIREDPAERIAQALARLPEHYEKVLRAKYLDQLPVETIARDFSLSAKAVESLLTRARSAFRQAYESAQAMEESHHE